MAIRTNEQNVLDLVPTDSQDISKAIKSASVMVDNLLADADLTEGTLAQIETYLAAHFLAQNPSIRKETGIKLMEYKEGLKNTNFGQQAIDLDSSNILQQRNSNSSFELKVFV